MARAVLADEREVGLAVLGERRRHADQDGVAGREAPEIRRHRGAPALEGVRDSARGNVTEKAFAAAERPDLGLIDIEPRHREAGPRGAQGGGEPDVTHAEDADMRAAAAQRGHQRPDGVDRRDGRRGCLDRHGGA